MAKYDITYSCGHTETKQLFGPGRDRESYIDWATRSAVCSGCRHNAASAANQVAAESNREAGLPALTGSEKQVAWAETIRQSVAYALTKADASGANQRLSPAAQQEVSDAMALVVDEVLGQTSASWWIDHRDDGMDKRWVSLQIRTRNLAPAAQLELAALTADNQARQEAEAKRTGEAMEAAIRESGIDAFGLPVYTLVDGVTVEIDTFGNLRGIKLADGALFKVGPLGHLEIGGKVACVPPEQRRIAEHLMVAARRAAKVLHERQTADAQARFEQSIAGVRVVSVETTKKRSDNLIASLSNGHQAVGDYTKSRGATITAIWSDYGSRYTARKIGDIARTHPEAVRLAAEAQAKI